MCEMTCYVNYKREFGVVTKCPSGKCVQNWNI